MSGDVPRMKAPKKPASKKVSAWACGVCGNVFRATKHAPTRNGKAFADACCTCTVEGCTRATGRYIGGRGDCGFHPELWRGVQAKAWRGLSSLR